MTARRKTATGGRTKGAARASSTRRGVVRQTALGVLVAGVLFGGGVGLGAWLAGGAPFGEGVHEAPPSRVSDSGPATSAAKPRPEPADIPLPKLKATPSAPPPVTAADQPSPEPTTSSVAAPPPPPPPRDQPAWRRFAVAARVPAGAPMIAIVLDDLGIDRRRSSRAVALPAPLTLAYLPYADDLETQTRRARGQGHELLVHIPMQPHGLNSDPGPNVLDMRLGAIEVLSRIAWNLGRFSGYVGVNNHMGSLFTESDEGMRLVAESLRDRGLLFLDSLTSPKSVAAATARALGVPVTTRDVFLDNTDTTAEVRMRLEQTERIARKTGTAIAIGHPRDATLEVLADWIPRARAAGIALVPLTAVLDVRRGDAQQQASRP